MIFLSIGSNLDSKFGGRLENIKKTMGLLISKSLKITKCSSVYETPSYPDNFLPKFLNIVIEIKYNLKPENLLSLIEEIENKMERVRVKKNDPRTCDIDIIDFNKYIVLNEKIKLPHPRLHDRNFVLFPLREISPNWFHPKNNKKIDYFINKLTQKRRNEITRLKDRVIFNT